MTQEEYIRLEQSFLGIRDERGFHKNTATRIGTAFLELLRLSRTGEFDEIVFNKVLNRPEFLKGLIALGSIALGEYVEGTSGGILTPEGDAELRNLLVREHTQLGDGLQHRDASGKVVPAVEVKGDAVFSGNLSSPDFLSGFPAGFGWALQRKEFVNAAGETEYKYILECDGANIRGTLRVYEMLISQLLGENDNRIFTAMLEVHHYDPATGKVWLSTGGGKMYNPFRKDDCILVQQYQPGNDMAAGGDGYITKSYELLVTDVGTGGMSDENGDRLDWVTFTNFTTMMEGKTAAGLIAEHDTFCRVDNLSDPERKGIIQMVTVGTNAPYMDILYGMKTDPEGALKGRLGNLEGIYHHLFGWLEGFGEYLTNAYIVGDVRVRRTGESLDTALQMVKGLLALNFAETVYELTEEDNFLSNAGFTELNADGSLRDWTVSGDDVSFYTVGGDPVISSVGTLADVRSCVKTEMIDGRQVLHIVSGSMRQSRSVMSRPEKHRVYDEGDGTEQTEDYSLESDTLYLSVRIRVLRQGTLTIGFPYSTETDAKAIRSKVSVLERGDEWATYQWSGTWDGLSDFVLGFTGECYVSLLSLTTDPLQNFKTEYSTQIVQTARNISLIASRTSSNESSIAELKVTADSISATVESNYTALDGRITSANSKIEQTASAIRLEVSESVEELDGKISSANSKIEQTATAIRQEVSSTVTAINGDIDSLEEDLGTTNGNLVKVTERVGQLEVTDQNITARVSSVETTTARHTTDISGLNSDVDGLSDSLSTTNGNLVKVTERVGQLEVTDKNITARVSSVETTTARHTTDISTISGNVSSLEDDVDSLESGLGTANASIVSLSTRVSNVEVTNTSISNRVAAVEGRPLDICNVDFWEQGTTDEHTGQSYEATKNDSTSRIRTKGLYPVTDGTVCMLSADGMQGYNVFFVYFDASKRVCGTTGSGWLSQEAAGGKISVGRPGECAYVAVLLRKKEGGAITVDDVRKTGITITSDTVVSQGEISVFLTEDKLSNIRLKADNIDFEFSKRWSVGAKGKGEVMYLTTDGDLYLKGNIYGGNVTGELQIGSGTNKMYIRPNGTNGAELVGIADGETVLSLGWSDSKGHPTLKLNQDGNIIINSSSKQAGISADRIVFYDNTTSKFVTLGIDSNGIIRFGRVGGYSDQMPRFPSSGDDIEVGQVFVDSSGYLKVKS